MVRRKWYLYVEEEQSDDFDSKISTISVFELGEKHISNSELGSRTCG